VIGNLTGREWNWKETGKKSSGVIAQEVEVYLPHLVGEGEDGIKNVNYDGLTAYLIEAVKELQAQINELKDS